MPTRRSKTRRRTAARPRPPRLPGDAKRAAALLSALPGVFGVFWGHRRSRREWQDEHVLSVHVQRKWDAPVTQAIPKELFGIPTDVLEVGTIRYQSLLDTNDRVRSSARGDDSLSGISALAEDDDGRIIALMSGHGTLLPAGGGFEAGPWPKGQAPWARLVDDQSPDDRLVELVDGAVTKRIDFAFGYLSSDVTSDDVLLGHTLCSLPIESRKNAPQVGERVYQVSPERGFSVAGQVAMTPAHGPLNDGVGLELEGALVVRPVTETAFSVGGDSGSLVLDADRRAVGFVVAGSEDESVSYLLPINRSLQQRLGRVFPLFFEVKG
jgi:hypothetical protein